MGLSRQHIVKPDGTGVHTRVRERAKRQSESRTGWIDELGVGGNDTYRHQDATDAHVRTEPFTDAGAFPEDA